MTRKLLSILLLVTLILPYILIVPQPGAAQYTGYVWLKAGTKDFYGLTEVPANITIGRYNIFRIIMDKDAAVTDIGPIVNITLLYASDYFRPQVGGYRILSLVRIDANKTWAETGGRYNITVIEANLTGTLKNYTIIAINMSTFDLSNVPYITNVYYGTVSYVNLYNTDLFVKLWQATSFEAAISNNFVRVVDPGTTPSDVKLGIDPGTTCSAGREINVTVVADFSSFLEKIYVTSGYHLTINDANLTYIKMYNKFDAAGDNEYLVTTESGVVTYKGVHYFDIDGGTVDINDTTIVLRGELQDFAPTIPDLLSDEIRAYYVLEAHYNFTIENDTLAISFIVTADTDTASPITGYSMSFVVYASLVMERNDYYGLENQTNPGDLLAFVIYHLPEFYVTAPPDIDIANFTISKVSKDYTVTIDVADFTIPPLYGGNGTGAFGIAVPNGLWDGDEVGYKLVFNGGKYIVRTTACTVLRDRIYPYINVYTLHNTTLYSIEDADYFYGTFIDNATTAPGDYLMIHGYGFNTSMTLYAFLRNATNTSILYQIIVADTTTSSGEVYAVLRIKDAATGLPLPTGSYILYFGTNYSWPYVMYNVTVAVGGDLEKIMINPAIVANATGYVIRHSKIGERVGISFDADYPLVTDAGAPGNDTFANAEWELGTAVEVIGYDTSSLELELFNKRYNISYPWMTLTLIHGYNYTSLYGKLLPFLPYGNYTLFFDNETIPEIDNDTIFTVYTAIDVDYDECRAGYFNVTIIGAAPSTNVSVEIEYGIVVNGTFRSLGTPLWNGTLVLENITTNLYGYGFKSWNSTTLYPADYIVNTSYYLLGVYRLNGTGTIKFYYDYYAEVTRIYDNATEYTVNWGSSDYMITLHFLATVNYNITVTIVGSTHIPRFNITITVPDVALPGDLIPVQIFVHTADVHGALIDVPSLLHTESVKHWWMMAKLVRVRDNAVVYSVEGYFNEHPEWYIVAGDLDGDGEEEVWWQVDLEAPLVIGSDEAYRVDLHLIIAYNTTPLPPSSVSYVEAPCSFLLNLSGSIGWTVYDTGYLIDHHEVMVLGLLEMKLDIINDTVAYIRGVVEDTNGRLINLSNYIHVNITELLLTINNTAASIKNDTAEILVGVAEIKMELADIMTMLNYIQGNVSLVISYEENETAVLERINTSLSNLTLIVLNLRSDVMAAFDNLVNTTLPSLARELYTNITGYINATNDSLVAEIEAVKDMANETRSLVIALTADLARVEDKIDFINSTLFNDVIPFLHTFYNDVADNLTLLKDSIVYNITARLDELNTTINESFERVISLLIAVNSSVYDIRPILTAINASINAKLDELENNFTAQLTMLENSILLAINGSTANLTLLINNKASYLGELIENKTAEIIATLAARIMSAEDNITASINASTDRLCMAIRSTNSTLYTLIENKTNAIVSTMKAINATLMTTLDDIRSSILAQLNVTSDNLTLLIKDVNRTLYMEIEDKATGLASLINYTRAVILAALNDTKVEITASIDASTDRLCMAIRSTNSTLYTLIENKTDYLEALATTLAESVNTTLYNAIISSRDDVLLAINVSTDSLETLINSSTTSLHAHINASTEYLAQLTTGLIENLNATLLNRLDDMEGYLSFLITYETSYLEGKLYDVADNITYTLLVAIDNARTDLKNTIILKADQIRYELNETRLELIAKLGDVEATIVDEIGNLKTYLQGEISKIETDLGTIKANTQTIIRAVNNLAADVDMYYGNLTTLVGNVNETLYALTLSVGDRVIMTVIGNATNIYNFINETSTAIKGDISSLLRKLLDVNTTLTTMLSQLSDKIDSSTQELSNSLAKATTTLQNDIKDLKSSTTEGLDKTNNSVVMFGAASLLLLAIIIGLTGYSLIKPRG